MEIRNSLAFSSVAVALLIPFTSAQNVTRKPLIKADVGGQTVGTVDVREIQYSPFQKAGPHIHPCPVVGYVVKGTIRFQIEGQSEKVLHAGDAFYEPANTKIVAFDALGDAPATFIADYLLPPGQTELIRKAN